MNHTEPTISDPLLASLVLFSRLYHRPVSVNGLIAGIPIAPGHKVPELAGLENPEPLFVRLAARAGFASRMTASSLENLSDLLLPCILILRGNKACILDRVDQENNVARVIFPELGDGEEWIPLDKLADQYLGYAFLLKKKYHYQSRSLQLVSSRRGHWFWSTLWRSRHLYTGALIASLMINLFVLATPLFTMNVYDRVVPHNALDTLWVLAIGVVLVYLFDTVLRFVRTKLLEMAGKKSDVILSSTLFEQALNLKMDQWPRSVGAFASNLREFDSIRNFFTAASLSVLIDLPFAIIFLLVILTIGGPLALIPLTTALLLLVYGYLMVAPLKKAIEATYEASSNKHALLVENLAAIQTIKTLGTHNHSQWEWEEATGKIAALSMRSHTLSSSISVVTNLLTQLTTVALIITGVYMISSQTLSLGGLIAVMILSTRAISPMGQLASLVASFEQTKAAFRNLDRLMHSEVERPDGKAFIQPPKFEGAIAMEGVSFAYPGSESPALKNVSLQIRPGEHVAIIGKTGSGKSTIGRLLLKLYEAGEGTVLIDGIDIRQISPADLRHHMAYVSQDIELLRGTVRENILYKDPQADDDALLRASHLGAVEQFINRNPRGFDMEVGELGTGLSGGQRQSIGIARALLTETPFVVLDEPTSAMDSTTEALIRQRLKKYTDNKTLVLITHKPAMLELVNRIVVLDEGRVVLDGPKEDVLMALQGNKRGQ